MPRHACPRGLPTLLRAARQRARAAGPAAQGAVIVLCMFVTFVLGLFVNLVVTRWRAAPPSHQNTRLTHCGPTLPNKLHNKLGAGV